MEHRDAHGDVEIVENVLRIGAHIILDIAHRPEHAADADQRAPQAGQAIPERKPILELNPKHAVLEKLGARFAASPTDPLIADAARLLLGQAVIAGGGQLEDPAEFTAIVNRLMTDVL